MLTAATKSDESDNIDLLKKRVFFQKKHGLKKTVFFADFVASGNTDCALLFPGF